MSTNNIPHIVDQGASIMRHEGMREGEMVTPTYVLNLPPKHVGCWTIGESWRVYVQKKVSDEQIKATEELLGWKWHDGDFNDHYK